MIIGFFFLFPDEECCKSVNVSSFGPAFISQKYSFGVYTLDENLTVSHTRHIYKKKNDIFKHFIYHLPDLNVWFVGPEPGKNYGYLVNTHGFVNCPSKLDEKSWFYLGNDKLWHMDARTIKIACIH